MSIELIFPQYEDFKQMTTYMQDGVETLRNAGFVFKSASTPCKLIIPEVTSPKSIYFMATDLDIKSGMLLSNYQKLGPFVALYDLYGALSKKVPFFNKEEFLANLESLKLEYLGSTFDLDKLFNFTSVSSTTSLVRNYLYREGLLGEMPKSPPNLVFEEIYSEIKSIYTVYAELIEYLRRHKVSDNQNFIEQESRAIRESRYLTYYAIPTNRVNTINGSWMVDASYKYQRSVIASPREFNKSQVLFTNLMELVKLSDDSEYAQIYASLHSSPDDIKKVIKNSSIKDIVKGSYLSSIVKKKEKSLIGIDYANLRNTSLSGHLRDNIVSYNKRYILILSSLLDKL